MIIQIQQRHGLGLQMLYSWSVIQRQDGCNIPDTDELGMMATQVVVKLSQGLEVVGMELTPLQVVMAGNACDEMIDYIKQKVDEYPQHERFLNDTILSLFELGELFRSRTEEVKAILNDSKATKNIITSLVEFVGIA